MVEFKTRISKVVDFPVVEGPSTRVFEVPIPPGINFPYISGQFAMIGHADVRLLANPNVLKFASYSISSAPTRSDILEFCIGDGSPTGVSHKLLTCNEGEEIIVKGPFGKFLLDENAPEYVFLATGTGIAPMISMVRTLLSKKITVPITLYFGFRYPSQFMYHEELVQLQKTHSNFKMEIIASRPDSSWAYHSGHMQDTLKNFSSPRLAQTKVYICGKPAVAEELVKFCIETMKFTPENVLLEKW
jgi:NAD(P)H-flavin reductase